jgi:hypothetical protein
LVDASIWPVIQSPTVSRAALHQRGAMLIAEARPGDDAPVLAHLLLSPLAAEHCAHLASAP